VGLFRNIRRVIGDIAPVVSAVAPIVAPGLGGFLISQVAGRIARNTAPRANPAVAVARGAPVVPPFCPRMGVVGRPFSGQFQSRNFSSGGAFPGRPFVFTGGRVPVGRDIVAQFCPTAPAALPITTPATTGQFASVASQVQAVAAAAVPSVVVPPSPVVVPPPAVFVSPTAPRLRGSAFG